MVYCQSCGTPNPAGSRFCNQCGTAIAEAGAPGGPIAPGPAAPEGAAGGERAERTSAWALHEGPVTQGGLSGMLQPIPPAARTDTHVSLTGIGVVSKGRAWVALTLGGVLMAALGAAVAIALLRGGQTEEDAPASEAEPGVVAGGEDLPPLEEPPVDFGLPHGLAVPEEGLLGAATPVPRRRPSGSTGGSGRAASGGAGAGSGSGSGSRGGSGGGGSSGSATPPGGGSGGEGAAGGGSSGSGAGGGRTEGGGAPSGGGGGGPPDEGPPERDLELDLYSARVRYVVRRYYAARARTCFERATRNDPNLSGTVVVRFTIEDDGTVGPARVSRNTTSDSALGACLVNRVKEWRLPTPPGGSLELEMPFSG